MIIKNRDDYGRLRVPYFVKLIGDFLPKRGIYNAGDFKSYVESLGILKMQDWDYEANGYPKWKHRVDRAAQKIQTGI
jgi:hypothetical protein